MSFLRRCATRSRFQSQPIERTGDLIFRVFVLPTIARSETEVLEKPHRVDIRISFGILIPRGHPVNKTIYVRDEDLPIWDKAKEYAGDKLAPIIMDGLRTFVNGRAASAQGFERVEVRYEDAKDHYIPKAKAFYGRWIFPPDNPIKTYEEDEGSGYCSTSNCAIAFTAKSNVVIYSWRTDSDSPKFNERFEIYESLEAAAKEPRLNSAIRQAIENIGVRVEELDI